MKYAEEMCKKWACQSSECLKNAEDLHQQWKKYHMREVISCIIFIISNFILCSVGIKMSLYNGSDRTLLLISVIHAFLFAAWREYYKSIELTLKSLDIRIGKEFSSSKICTDHMMDVANSFSETNITRK